MMKISNNNRADIAARLRSMRRAQFGALALVSLSTLRALSAVEDREASRLTRSIVAAGHTDDSIVDADSDTVSRIELAADTAPAPHSLAGYSLTPAERAALLAARPQSRSVIFRAPVTVDTPDPVLPALSDEEIANDLRDTRRAANAEARYLRAVANVAKQEQEIARLRAVFVRAEKRAATAQRITPGRERIAAHLALVERLRAAGITYARA